MATLALADLNLKSRTDLATLQQRLRPLHHYSSPVYGRHTLIQPDKEIGANHKYSRNLWLLVSKHIRKCPMVTRLSDNLAELRDAKADQDMIVAARDLVARARASSLNELRILLVADSSLALAEDDFEHGQLYIARRMVTDPESAEPRLVEMTGSRMSRIDGSEGLSLIILDGPRRFVDVTEKFWDVYLNYGLCFMIGMKHSTHRWTYVTRNSRRCACCGIWSYAKETRTLQRTTLPAHSRDGRDYHGAALRERVITQTRNWSLLMPRILNKRGGRSLELTHVFRRQLELAGY